MDNDNVFDRRSPYGGDQPFGRAVPELGGVQDKPLDPPRPLDQGALIPAPDTRTPVHESPRVPYLPADHVVDFARSGLESLLWRSAEVASSQLSPLGPVIIRTLYFGKQLRAVAAGLQSGEGFMLKVTIPGLDLGSDGVLPPGIELVARVNLGNQRAGDIDTDGVRLEIQIFEPWFNEVDVRRDTHKPGGIRQCTAVSAARTADVERPDPWRIWLNIIGDPLIHDLARTLATATGLRLPKLEAALLAERDAARELVPIHHGNA